jgi:hypothetical protein
MRLLVIACVLSLSAIVVSCNKDNEGSSSNQVILNSFGPTGYEDWRYIKIYRKQFAKSYFY